jgi:hypothetical protein
MMRTTRLAALLGGCLCLIAGGARADETLTIRVSPAISAAPAVVTIRTMVEAHADNRTIDIIAESRDFYTSTQVTLQGADAPRFNEVRFRSLPAGSYEVTVVLMGSHGRRAWVTRKVVVGVPESDR